MRQSLSLPRALALGTALSLAACGGTETQRVAGAGAGTTGTASAAASSTGAAASGTAAASSGTSTGGSSTGGASSAGSGSSSGGTQFQGCQLDWAPCTPANICDIGCTPDGGACFDSLSANLAQTGVSCGTDAVCEGTTCLAGSGPQLPNQNGGVLTQPNLVIMTYNTDPNQQAIEDWAVWIADGGFLPTSVGQYGVGNGTVQFVHLTDVQPDESDVAVQQYVQTHFDGDSNMPSYTQENIYLLFFPNDWPGTGLFCQTQGGYHTFFGDQSGNYPVYAVVAACRNDLKGDIEVAGSHEIAEAATDPYVSSWTFDNAAASWAYIGGEVGDMCESNTNYYLSPDGNFAAQYLWSNSAAKAGQVPCQPWPDGVPYVSVLGPTTLVPGAPGATVDIPITGWASAAIASWGLIAQDAFFGVDFQTSPGVTQQSISPGEQVMAELNIPTTGPGQPAIGGKVGAAWILSATNDTGYYGSAAVGVTVSCETSADCGSELYSCTVASGVGTCDYNSCAKTAKSFSACTSTAGNDGVCLPLDSSTGTAVEICNQAGSLAAGSQGCATERIVGAGAAAYCDTSSICEGSQSPTCFTLCTFSSNPRGSCSANASCYPLGQYYGFCVPNCGSSIPCPSGQQCYAAGSFGDICYPN